MDATASNYTSQNPSRVRQDDSRPAGALPSGTQLYEFTLTSTLGEGGFSIVYAARDNRLHRDVAIKEYMPAAFASRSDKARIEVRSERHRSAFDTGMHSFIDEARLLARFKHPALVEVLRFWEDNGTAYMAMPRYSGQTLRQILRDNGGQCDEQWLRGIVAPMLDVLEMLHAHDIFHRDVAPDNIIIQNDGTPVLLDLGSARRVLGDANQAPTVIVKPGYAPIEQYAEDLSTPQGPWTDIYALGAVLHLAVTGMAPSASVSRLMKDNLEPLSGRDFPGFSEAFLRTIDHCLALQPGDRPQAIAQLRELLGIDGTVQARPLPTPPTTPRARPAVAADDAKTIILSSEQMADLMAQAVGGQAAPQLPDPFQLPSATAKQEAEETSFPEMEELLNGDAKRNAGKVAVPSVTHAAPAPSPARAAPAAKSRAPLIGLSAAACLLVAGAVGWGLWSGRDDADTQTALAQATTTTVPEPVAKSEIVTPPAVQPVEETPAASDPAFIETPASVSEPLPPVHAVAPEPVPVQVVEPIPQPIPEPAPAPQVAVETRPAATARASEATPPPAPARSRQQQEAVVDTGTVQINVQPWGEVWVDGKNHGASPPLKKLDLPVGEYRIELRRPNQPALVHKVVVEKNATITLNQGVQTSAKATQKPTAPAAAAPAAATKPAAPEKGGKGTLALRIQPWGEIWVDGVKRGVSPPLQEIQLPAGARTIEIRNPSFPSQSRKLDVPANRRVTLQHSFQ
ncbi:MULTISPECIES: serine/threonine-protein kinase [unclassified Pseudomonas]|uniref:serine/threonine-protein kinase n=1 Tax=unclassified Pseudomonas TaxID=196821 RepID=UPI00244D746D|nr:MULTISPECIES: serine/threonine-protein kinase [unclassified Pseudomonas]MDG9926937.1 protein kinase [Pseudomonas sp. GD04042]MDH0484580.1 protein kinase [Pseudomonas sp. GD04015]MDH0602352.1 protein kinase [Pseudomonas sp. GD03869]